MSNLPALEVSDLVKTYPNGVQALKGDKGWTQKYLSGDADARSEMERLMRLGYPE